MDENTEQAYIFEGNIWVTVVATSEREARELLGTTKEWEDWDWSVTKEPRLDTVEDV